MKKVINLIFAITIMIGFIACGIRPQQKEESKKCCETKCKPNDIALAEGAIMHLEYVKTVARMAYVWGWPLVNSHNRRAGITQAPEPGRLGGVVPVAPVNRMCMLNNYVEPVQSFVACPNQDVAYGLSMCALNESPVVLQVPDFEDRFWVIAIYDARTDQFGQFGKAYKTEHGFYMLVSPTWEGEKPDGITEIVRATTEMCFIAPRVFLNNTAEDKEAIKLVVNQINAYPVAEFDGKMKIKDWDKVPSFPAPPVEGERSWVVAEAFFDQLPGVMDLVPPMPGEEALYASIRQVLEAAEKILLLKRSWLKLLLILKRKLLNHCFYGSTMVFRQVMGGIAQKIMHNGDLIT